MHFKTIRINLKLLEYVRLLCRCDRNDNNKTKTFGKNLHTSSSSRMHVINHNFLSHETASSSAECSRDKKPFSFVRGQDSTMWNIVWVSPQGHRSMSVSRHFLLQAPQSPRSVQKRFSRDHCCRGRLKPGCRIVGSHTRWELTICVLKCIYYTFQASSEAFSAPVTLTCGFSLKFCYSWGFPSSVWKKMTWTFLALPWQANHILWTLSIHLRGLSTCMTLWPHWFMSIQYSVISYYPAALSLFQLAGV